MMITYMGIDKRGASRAGLGMFDAVEFVETRFNRGWRRLTVKSSETGAVIGTIRTNNAGVRIWWAES